jgi:hypothetical protein
MARIERPGCPLAEFLNFPVNTKLYARLWLRNGVVHPAAHWIIRERLAGWVERVATAPVEVRAALALEAAPAGAPRQAPQAWVKSPTLQCLCRPRGASPVHKA